MGKKARVQRSKAKRESQARAENANTENEIGIVAGNAIAEDAQATTENAITEKGIAEVDVPEWRILTSEEAAILNEMLAYESKAATENANTEKEIGESSVSDRALSSEGTSTSVRVGDKTIADKCHHKTDPLMVPMDVDRMTESGEIVTRKKHVLFGGGSGLKACLEAIRKSKGKESAASKVGNDNDEVKAVTSTEITGGKKGIHGSEASKKAKGKESDAPQVGNVDNDEGETIVNNEEKQNGDAEDGEDPK